MNVDATLELYARDFVTSYYWNDWYEMGRIIYKIEGKIGRDIDHSEVSQMCIYAGMILPPAPTLFKRIKQTYTRAIEYEFEKDTFLGVGVTKAYFILLRHHQNIFSRSDVVVLCETIRNYFNAPHPIINFSLLIERKGSEKVAEQIADL